jgi:YggT family protein
MLGGPFWDYWYFHVPNYAAAVLTYTLLGRFLFSLFLPPNSTNYIFRFFCLLTDWSLALCRYITPRLLQGLALPLVAAFWFFVLRHAYFLLLRSYDLVPKLGVQ